MEIIKLRDDFIATLTHDLRTPLLAAIQTGGGAMSVMNKADAAMETGTKSISDEESEDYEEDETLVQSALRWMIND
mgnify:CR=1 FL=1